MRRLLALSFALLLIGCGEPLQVANRTPGPSRTPLVARTTLATPQVSPTAEASAVATAPPATAASTAPVTTVAATQAPRPSVVVVPATRPPRTSQERWRAQQEAREPIDPPAAYVVGQPAPLLWWDPATGQALEIGLVAGEVPAQARFVFRPTGEPAIEVAYRIGQDFGLTAISAAVRARMAAAGFNETVEAYLVVTDSVNPR